MDAARKVMRESKTCPGGSSDVDSSSIPDRVNCTSTGVALQRKSLSLAGFDLSVSG